MRIGIYTRLKFESTRKRFDVPYRAETYAVVAMAYWDAEKAYNEAGDDDLGHLWLYFPPIQRRKASK